MCITIKIISIISQAVREGSHVNIAFVLINTYQSLCVDADCTSTHSGGLDVKDVTCSGLHILLAAVGGLDARFIDVG